MVFGLPILLNLQIQNKSVNAIKGEMLFQISFIKQLIFKF